MWGRARRKPTDIRFREPLFDLEVVLTPAGPISVKRGNFYIIEGTVGELYPIEKTIFHQTYEVTEEIQPPKESAKK